jgi:Ser/Thr protein kinase RdoA (MazF antagonist)
LEGEYDLNFLAHSDAGERYIFKVMRSHCDRDFVAMQIAALAHIHVLAPNLPFPKVLESQHGECLVGCTDADGNHRLLWLMEFLPGQSYAQSTRKSPALIADLGRALGTTDSALASFKHPALSRDFKWNLTQSLWIEAKLDIISDPQRRALLERIIDGYKAQQAWLMRIAMRFSMNGILMPSDRSVSGMATEPSRE